MPADRSLVFLDIETTADKKAVESYLARHPQSAPANWVDKDKIAAKVAEKTEAVKRDAAKKVQTAAISCVSLCWEDSDDLTTFVNSGMTERKLLESLSSALVDAQTICTFNGRTFDLPIIRMRHLHHGVVIPWVLRSGRKYSQNRCLDIRDNFTGFDDRATGKLGDYCDRAGVEGPIPHDGAAIAALIAAKNWPELKSTCESDVLALKRLYNRAHSVGYI